MTTVLLKNTNNNVNIIEHVLSDLRYSYEFRSNEENNVKRVECFTSNDTPKVKGIITINNLTILTKETTLSYSGALITDQSIITNYQYLINNHTNNSVEYQINIDNVEYISNKYFNLNGVNFYILTTV
jgi:hypothetical protein